MLQKLIQAAIITSLLQLVINLSPPKTQTTLNLELSQVPLLPLVD